MNWVDWILVALVALCTLHGLISGALRQAFILMRIILALLIATAVHVVWLPPSLVERGEAMLPAGTLYAVSLAILYVLAWVALYLVFLLVHMITPTTSDMDLGQRLGGGLLGMMRGVALVFLLVLVVDYSSLAMRDTWQNAPLRQRLSPYAQDLRRGVMQADNLTRQRIEDIMRMSRTWQQRDESELLSSQ